MMKAVIKYIAPWLGAAAIGGAVALGPINPTSPDIFGYHTANEVANPTNSEVDVPF